MGKSSSSLLSEPPRPPHPMRSYSDCLSAAGGGERGLMMESRRPGEIERSKFFPHMMDEDGGQAAKR